MAKLKLVAAPTFSADVPIPVAGGEPVQVNMTFKHRTKVDLGKWLEGRAGREDVDSFLDIVTAWELQDEFTRENVSLLLENYGGAAVATLNKYIFELTSAKQKN